MKKNENGSTEVEKDADVQPWKGFSVFLHVLLPIAGLALLWGQRGFFSKLMLQLDRSCVAVYCPSLSKREKLLKWASDRLPSTWSSQARTLSSGIPELWKDGSLLCTLINSVVPGACPNPHRHWRKPPLHAQALAYKYLGLVPMFTEDELSGEFTIHKERTFINYLHSLQEAVNNWPTRNELNRKFSFQYVARGMGLYTSEQHRKTVFYVYANTTTKKRSNVLMHIRGPYGTQGTATIPPFHNLKTIPVVNVLQDQLEATQILPFKNNDQKSFLKTISLDFTSLMNSVEDHEQKNEIPIQIDMEIDRAKITYIPNSTGMYEINLICDGELLRGSPYSVQVINNTSGKKDCFNTDYENVEERITFTKRTILSKVIDCIDEKICIDNDKISKIWFRDSTESSAESENDDLTITAVTKKKDEILKTEINCTLEDIIEEINSVQDKAALDQTQSETNNKDKEINGLDKIKTIVEKLKSEVSQTVETFTGNKETSLQVDSQHKIVKSWEDAQTEMVNLFQQEDDEVDHPLLESQPPEGSFVSKLDTNLIESTKYLKNIVNSSSRHEMFEKILPIELNRKKYDDDNKRHVPVKRIKSKICFEISPKSINKTNTSFDSSNHTSQICPDHIVPEVKRSSLNQLTLSEKRKTLSKQDSVSIPDCDVTFSSSENDELSKSKDSEFRELSVLNVLDSLKQSRKNSFSDYYPLTSTVSLPNINSIESSAQDIDGNIFRARKDYWERLSSRSSSSISLSNSDYSHKKRSVAKKNVLNKYNIDEKNFVNEIEKNNSTANNNNAVEEATIDTSLEDCTIIPLEERKKQLLKNMYNQETHSPRKLNVKINFFKKNNKPKNEEKLFFAPISDRVETFDSNNKGNSEEEMKKPTKHSIKSQFKRAVKFFKNLEENSRRNRNVIRRYSLDCQKKNPGAAKGGSLNLPNVSKRFSIDNLYEDVMRHRNGSFKGTPNSNGVVNSLASFQRNLQEGGFKLEEEDNISYDLFKNKSRNKKRKSIRSLFDVNY